MQMLYGVNQADQCRDFALGPARERIWRHLREIDTRMIRLFLFDKGAPDPVTEWPVFASYVQAVLNVGATPMITFAKLNRPLDDPRAVRWFANQCADVVWNCIEQWGGEAVRDWYWCVWNEPNNEWISGERWVLMKPFLSRTLIATLRAALGLGGEGTSVRSSTSQTV